VKQDIKKFKLFKLGDIGIDAIYHGINKIFLLISSLFIKRGIKHFFYELAPFFVFDPLIF
jgi:hypothetical protein